MCWITDLLEQIVNDVGRGKVVRGETRRRCLAWRDCIESRLSDMIFKTKEIDVLLKHVAHFPEAIDAVERLIELLPLDHPAHQSLNKFRDIS